MTRLAITIVGIIASALIKFIGVTWELRAFAVIPVFSLTLGGAGLAYTTIYNTPHIPATPTSISLISWGERNAEITNDNTMATSAAHIIYATVQLTAGDSALHIPDIDHPDPQNRLWLAIDDTTRQSPNGHIATISNGHTYQWLPSHQARLMPAVGAAEPYLIPDAACSTLDPGHTCTITVAWELTNYGDAGPIHSLILETSAPDGSQRHTEYPWPPIPAETTCTGAVFMFCGNTIDLP